MLDADDQTDNRQWTQQHLDAADLRIPSIAPTPPQGEIENDCLDVNVRGPGVLRTIDIIYISGTSYLILLSFIADDLVVCI